MCMVSYSSKLLNCDVVLCLQDKVHLLAKYNVKYMKKGFKHNGAYRNASQCTASLIVNVALVKDPALSIVLL